MLLTHPALVLVTVCAVWFVIERVLVRSDRAPVVMSALALVACALAASAFVAIVVWYTFQPAYFDPAEPTITAVSTVFGYGGQLYPALDAPERYAHIYGPDLFIIQAAAMKVFGATVLVSKSVGAFAVLAGLFLSYGAFRRIADRRAALIAIGSCAAVYLAFGNLTFWTRPEPLLILCAALALYGATSKSWALSIAAVAIAAGVSWNVKFSGPLYVLPSVVLFTTSNSHSGLDGRRRRGWLSLVVIVVLAAALATAPFFIRTISPVHYLQYIELSAHNGLLAARLRQNIEWAVVLMAPVMAAVAFARREGIRGTIDRFIVCLALCVVVIVIIAAKPGAGPYHLLPMLPLLAYAVLRLPPDAYRGAATRTIVAGVVITGCVFAIPRQRTLIQTLRGNEVAQAMTEVRTFVDAHPSASVGVGYAGTSRWSQARVEAVFRTHDYWLDAPAVQEHRLAGLAIPESVIRSLDECRTRYWLIPLAGEAFLVPSAYWQDAGPAQVLPDAFRQAFMRSYSRVGETRYFAVWQCLRETRVRRETRVSGGRSAFPDARSANER